MNQYIGIHTHAFGETVYMFRSPLNETELRNKAFDEDGNMHQTFADLIGMQSYFEPELEETFAIHEILLNPIVE